LYIIARLRGVKPACCLVFEILLGIKAGNEGMAFIVATSIAYGVDYLCLLIGILE
jgi:hypothetical protein